MKPIWDEPPVEKAEGRFCIRCGKPAIVMKYGYTWCKKHQDYADWDPEDLEEIVIEGLREMEEMAEEGY